MTNERRVVNTRSDLPIGVSWQTPACREKAEALAKNLQLSLVNPNKSHFTDGYQLLVTEERLELVCHQQNATTRLFSEFVKGPLGYRRRKGGGKSQAIAKAVGLKRGKEKITLIDATAGFGRDAFVLASLGCRVKLIERSPIVAAILLDGLERAKQYSEIAELVRQMEVIVADARIILKNLSEAEIPDVIYLDPMFPGKTKSALAEGKMRILRTLVGNDLDIDELFSVALTKAKKRVVVKRPRLASTISNQKPSFSLEGKSNRFDIYLMDTCSSA